MKCYLVLAVLISGLILIAEGLGKPNRKQRKMALAEALNKEQVIPDVIDKAPSNILKVEYPSGVKVDLGKVLTPTQVKDLPNFDYDADSNKLYTITMVDPDALSRKDPNLREILHYLIVNIPGKDLSRGDTLAEYIGSGPPKGTGLHRYIFLLFEQKEGKLTSAMKILKTSREGRPKFSIRSFSKSNNLGDPIAANFYRAEYDDYVPTLHAQLSG